MLLDSLTNGSTSLWDTLYIWGELKMLKTLLWKTHKINDGENNVQTAF